MREGAVCTSLIEFEIPYNTRQQNDRRFHEEISLFLNPRLVEIEHYGVCRFVCVRDVGHERRRNGIASVAPPGIIEVYHIEFGSFGVFVLVLQEVVIDNGTEVREFEVITVQREPFLNLLFEKVVHYCIRLTGTGCAQYDCRPEGVDNIYPSVVPLFLVVESGGEIYRVFILDFARLLLERLVFIVEYVVHQIVLQQSTHPVAGHKQADESGCATHYI